jgi:hypothetical protein
LGLSCLDRPSCLGRPSSCLGRPSSCLGRPSSCLDRPSSCLDRPSSCLDRPSYLHRPRSPHRLCRRFARWRVCPEVHSRAPREAEQHQDAFAVHRTPIGAGPLVSVVRDRPLHPLKALPTSLPACLRAYPERRKHRLLGDVFSRNLRVLPSRYTRKCIALRVKLVAVRPWIGCGATLSGGNGTTRNLIPL